MNNHFSTLPRELSGHFVAVFEAMPGNAILIKLDDPLFTILAATKDYCQNYTCPKDKIIGRGFFEPFSLTCLRYDVKDANVLRKSFQIVTQTKLSHHLPLHPDPVSNDDSSFPEKYWAVTNKPVLDEAGNVIYLLHSVVDISNGAMSRQQDQTIQELKQVENLLKQVPVAIHIFKGEELTITFANDYTLRQWNRGPDVIGKTFSEQ